MRRVRAERRLQCRSDSDASRVPPYPTDIPEGAVEYTIETDPKGRTPKIAVHQQLEGNLVNCIPQAQLSGVHLIIATLPDPDKTEMRLEFDRYVDAIEKGAAIRGFHYTGYWFPWNSRESDPAPQKEDEVEAALLRTEQPGVLLFHDDQGERLIVFVVGETATSGIDRMQMVEALRYRQALINASSAKAKPAYKAQNVPATSPGTTGAKLKGPLIISGPSFSGGLTSLGEVLIESGVLPENKRSKDGKPLQEEEPSKARADSQQPPSVEILSPGVSSESLIAKFNEVCEPTTRCNFRSLSITAAQKETWQ